jgi:hypothetical protein
VVTATGWTYAELYETSICDVLELLQAWRVEPPVHIILGARYLGLGRNGPSAVTRAATPVDAEAQIGMLPQIAEVLRAPVRPISARTRQLYEYARGILRPAS